MFVTQLLEVFLWYSLRVTVALEMGTLILKRRNASATMAEMPLGSHRCFPRHVHSACCLRVYLVTTVKSPIALQQLEARTAILKLLYTSLEADSATTWVCP